MVKLGGLIQYIEGGMVDYETRSHGIIILLGWFKNDSEER